MHIYTKTLATSRARKRTSTGGAGYIGDEEKKCIVTRCLQVRAVLRCREVESSFGIGSSKDIKF